jgi:hypothetical protein
VSRIHAAPAGEALTALQFFVGWSGGWIPIERLRERETKRFWRRALAPGLPALVQDLDARYSDEIRFGLPQARRFNGGVGAATILWARVETGEQYENAKILRPLPSLVLREGGTLKRLLIWGLEEQLPWPQVVQANKRLAYRLGTKQADADPDRLWIPAPGTCLRVGRSRPVPVVCALLSTVTYTRDGVVGFLKDPPESNWWERKDNARVGGSR